MDDYRSYLKSRLDGQFLCICGDLLFMAYQAEDGSRICSQCYKTQQLQRGQTCPYDKAFVNRLMAQTIVCRFSGCELELTVAQLPTHDTECSYRPRLCNKCQEQMAVEENHTCDAEKRLCSHCDREVEWLVKDHLNVLSPLAVEKLCSAFRGHCDLCGKDDVVLLQHIRSSCRLAKHTCLLAKIGCRGFYRKNDNICWGNDNRISDHLDLINSEIGQIERILSEINFNKFHSHTIEFSADFDQMKKLESRLSELTGQLDRCMMMAKMSKRGRMVWRVEDASNFLSGSQGNHEYSPPVMAGDYGYKLCLKVFPCGDGDGNEDFVSVYFVVMRSDMDDLLSWPFNKKVKISLIHPSDSSKSIRQTLAPPTTSHVDQCYGRPKDDMNTASGCPKFIRRNRILQEGFIKNNDVLFFELEVTK